MIAFSKDRCGQLEKYVTEPFSNQNGGGKIEKNQVLWKQINNLALFKDNDKTKKNLGKNNKKVKCAFWSSLIRHSSFTT